ncbi:L-fucose:H+ symporter permease [Bartonella sp. DGB1]|uniref:L-fucose:H+ symporter permease n=1 Tax=Bartonella sp. DGB1 TaxID=3239807 RepID=UPI003524460B
MVAHGSTNSKKNKFIYKGYYLAFFCVTSLFFMWAVANNLNDVLTKHFQNALDLTPTQSSYIATVYFLGYFFMALPAGLIMHRIGYKGGIIVGLTLFACGVFLFYPGAYIRSFGFFLFALAIIASGVTFLETAANPFITIMGSPETASQRLNFAQSFNGLGAFVALILGGSFILSDTHISKAEIASWTPEVQEAYRVSEALSVQTPYLIFGCVVVVLIVLFSLVKMPDVSKKMVVKIENQEPTTASYSRLRLAIVAQFFAVGSQIAVSVHYINFAQSVHPSLTDSWAAYYVAFSMAGFMIGRFFGTFLLSFISAAQLLLLYFSLCIPLSIGAIFFDGIFAVICYGLLLTFISIGFPTIFSMGITGLGRRTKLGSSLLIMSIAGAALIPLSFAKVAELTNSWQIAMIVPMVAFLVVIAFAVYCIKKPQI